MKQMGTTTPGSGRWEVLSCRPGKGGSPIPWRAPLRAGPFWNDIPSPLSLRSESDSADTWFPTHRSARPRSLEGVHCCVPLCCASSAVTDPRTLLVSAPYRNHSLCWNCSGRMHLFHRISSLLKSPTTWVWRSCVQAPFPRPVEPSPCRRSELAWLCICFRCDDVVSPFSCEASRCTISLVQMQR